MGIIRIHDILAVPLASHPGSHHIAGGTVSAGDILSAEMAAHIEQVDLLNGYCLLSDEDKARIAAGPEEAVAVYNEGMAKRNVYCTYMVGRCALYGYGGVKDKDLAETCLERASIRNSFPAAFLLKKLAVGDSDKEKQYDRRLTNIVTHVIRELRDQ